MTDSFYEFVHLLHKTGTTSRWKSLYLDYSDLYFYIWSPEEKQIRIMSELWPQLAPAFCHKVPYIFNRVMLSHWQFTSVTHKTPRDNTYIKEHFLKWKQTLFKRRHTHTTEKHQTDGGKRFLAPVRQRSGNIQQSQNTFISIQASDELACHYRITTTPFTICSLSISFPFGIMILRTEWSLEYY